ncbi:MAG: J domain-containing protein [Capsulimonadaceae bacterium]
MDSVDNFYKIMGVGPTASAEEIKKRYRFLAREFHPDLTADPSALKTFQLINRAYRTLRDPDRRNAYDRDQQSLIESDRQKITVANLVADAEDALMVGLLVKARGICETVLEIDPNHVRALHILGDVHAGLNKTSAALDAYRRALSLAPGAALQSKVTRLEAMLPSGAEAASTRNGAAAKTVDGHPSLIRRLFLRRP